MPKGRSYSADQWEAFDKGGHSFVHQDFAHEKCFQFKAKLENPNEGITIKESISERSDGISSAGEVKFWLNIRDHSLYAKIGTDSNMNVQIDTGIKQIRGIKNNFYLGAEVNRTFTEREAFAGLEFFQDKKWSINSKFTHNFTNKISFFSQKFRLNVNEWRFNGFGTVDISKAILTKCGILAAWTPLVLDNKWNYFLTLRSPKNTASVSPQALLQNAVLAINHSVSDTHTLGLQAKINLPNLKNVFSHPSTLFPSIWLASQWKFGEASVKAKISKDLSHMITIKNKLGSYGTYSLGVAASEIGSKNKFKFGVQLDLNL